MTEHEAFSSERPEHDQATERQGDTWVAGSGSVVAPEGESTDTEFPEGGADQAADTGETDQANDRPWEVSPTEGDLGSAGADHRTPDDLGPGDYGTAEDAETAGTGSGASPAAGTTGEQIDHLIDPAESERFHASWREIQSSFVDDPRGAVHQASTLAEEVLNALSTALKARVRAVEDGWQGGDEQADTERLRIALRGYRALLDQVLAG